MADEATPLKAKEPKSHFESAKEWVTTRSTTFWMIVGAVVVLIALGLGHGLGLGLRGGGSGGANGMHLPGVTPRTIPGITCECAGDVGTPKAGQVTLIGNGAQLFDDRNFWDDGPGPTPQLEMAWRNSLAKSTAALGCKEKNQGYSCSEVSATNPDKGYVRPPRIVMLLPQDPIQYPYYGENSLEEYDTLLSQRYGGNATWINVWNNTAAINKEPFANRGLCAWQPSLGPGDTAYGNPDDGSVGYISVHNEIDDAVKIIESADAFYLKGGNPYKFSFALNVEPPRLKEAMLARVAAGAAVAAESAGASISATTIDVLLEKTTVYKYDGYEVGGGDGPPEQVGLDWFLEPGHNAGLGFADVSGVIPHYWGQAGDDYPSNSGFYNEMVKQGLEIPGTVALLNNDVWDKARGCIYKWEEGCDLTKTLQFYVSDPVRRRLALLVGRTAGP